MAASRRITDACLPPGPGYCPTLRVMPRVRPVTSVALAALVVVFGAAACVPSDSRPTLGDRAGRHALARADRQRRCRPRARSPRRSRRKDVHRVVHDPAQARRSRARARASCRLPPRTLVRIGDVALYSDPPQQTCDAATGTCEDGLLEQRISDIGVSSRFYGPATAQQLRVAVGRESSPPTVDTAQLAGIGAECLHVPVGGGEETYCVTGDGLLALLDTAAMHIELTCVRPRSRPRGVLPAWSGVDDDELVVDAVQRVGPVGRRHHDVLEAHAELAWHVDPGLDREGVARARAARRCPRRCRGPRAPRRRCRGRCGG